MTEADGSESKATAERVLDLLDALVTERGGGSLPAAAQKIGLPISTAHRLAALLVRRKLLVRGDRGQYLPGWGLAQLAQQADWRHVLSGVSRPFVRRLARKSACTVHVGVLDGDMVTYLVKEQGPGVTLFTQEGMQLEAYCSAIGKLLLSELPHAELEEYLRGAPFPALTSKTITEPGMLRTHLGEIRVRGYAIDDCEIADDLVCFAVPIRRPDGTTLAALSSAGKPPRQLSDNGLDDLRRCADEISARLF